MVLKADSPQVIQARFTKLDTEERYDVVRLYDGPNASAPLLGTFSGRSLPTAVVATSGQYLTVQWTSGQGAPSNAVALVGCSLHHTA